LSVLLFALQAYKLEKLEVASQNDVISSVDLSAVELIDVVICCHEAVYGFAKIGWQILEGANTACSPSLMNMLSHALKVPTLQINFHMI